MATQTKERQYFGEIRCKFSARKTRSGLAAIYANVTAPTERHYLAVALHVKVKPEQFNKRKQLCVVSNELTNLDNYNNRIANDAIKAFKAKVEDVNKSICDADDPYTVDVRDLLLPKRRVREVGLDELFFHIADQQLKLGSISGSAHARKVSVVRSFVSYYNGGFDSLNTEIYNGYRDWLIGQGRNISSINAYLSTVKTLVNEVNKTETRLFINTANWCPMTDKRSKEEKRSTNIMFTDTDLARIEALELTGRLAVVRDFFVFGCNVGQRPADCVRILRGECKRLEHAGRSYVELVPHKTKKTGNTATIPIGAAVVSLMEKFAVNEEYRAAIAADGFEKYATRKLKDIFSMAGIDSLVEVTRQNGIEKTTETLSVSSKAHLYLARHYFITKMIRQGLRPDEVIKMTGHSNTKMVNDIYTHLSSDDRCELLGNAFDRVSETE